MNELRQALIDCLEAQKHKDDSCMAGNKAAYAEDNVVNVIKDRFINDANFREWLLELLMDDFGIFPEEE